jgi:hypothetical protein
MKGPRCVSFVFFVLFIVVNAIAVCDVSAQDRHVTKRASSISLYPYHPKSTQSLHDLPSSVVGKVTAHLKARLGEEFFSKLQFSYGEIVNLDELKRADPNANYQWKVFSYKLEYRFSIPDVGIKLYEAEIQLDEKGDVLREIDLPDIAHNPNKANFITVTQALSIGKKNKFRAGRARIAYRDKEDSVVWRLIRENSDGSTSQLDISAHTGEILGSVSYKGISE